MGLHWPASEMPLNGVSLAGPWWPNIACWHGSIVVLQGIRTSIAKTLYFCDFLGGGSRARTPCSPSGSAHVESTVVKLFPCISIFQIISGFEPHLVASPKDILTHPVALYNHSLLHARIQRGGGEGVRILPEKNHKNISILCRSIIGPQAKRH